MRRRCSAAKSLSPSLIRLFSVGILRRIGFSPRTDCFAIVPKIRPMTLRGGDFTPAAISIHAEQCASICAAFIAPHCLSLSDLSDRGTNMGRPVALVLYVVLMAAVIVGVDLLFFRDRFWERLTVNIGIVLVFGAFYMRFLTRP
jgi:hypothetical protein